MFGRRRYRSDISILGLAGILLFAGCSSSTDPTPHPVELDIDEALDRWNSHAISKYAIEFRWRCFCARPLGWWRVTVSDGQVTDVAPLSGQENAADGSDFETVNGLLTIMKNAAEEDAHSIIATFDSIYGYPISVDIDYSEMVVDEELGFEVRRFDED